MITKRYVSSTLDENDGYADPEAVVGQTTAYDKASNKFYERSLQAESRSSLYEPFDADNRPEGGYDSIDRLRQYQRGVLSSTGRSITTPISLPGTDEDRTYDLDGLGNWKKTVFDPVGAGEETQVRQHNSLNEITRFVFANLIDAVAVTRLHPHQLRRCPRIELDKWGTGAPAFQYPRRNHTRMRKRDQLRTRLFSKHVRRQVMTCV